jgi:hypothetical protein|tara:strand:+ start:966 stop:1334 length:369 start_codon:yes stop_codon:yes gene_type:complete
MTNTFVFDTYAIIEILNGNENYDPYLDDEIIINDFIFAELCYNLIKEKGLEKPGLILSKYSKFILKVEPSIIKEAMVFRYANRKKDVSMADCISYFQAKTLNVKFLTGDKEFKDILGVEFVK